MRLTLKTENRFYLTFDNVKGLSVQFNFNINKLFLMPNLSWFWKSYKHITFYGLGFYIQVSN